MHNTCAAGHTCAAAGEPASAVAPARPDVARSQVARHLAPHLECAASEIEIEHVAGGITARGCGRTIQFLRACGEIDRPECLEEIEPSPQR